MISIKNKEQCCGCTACSSVCPKKSITMVEDNEGFLYPEVDETTCVECGLCEKSCPIINHSSQIKEIQQKAVIVQHKDKFICNQSTAGGAFTGIASYVINRGGVVFGATMDKNFIVHHTYVETISELEKFRNSKYVQSNIQGTYQQVKDFLKDGRMVCFSGTPCQIEGLRGFLNYREYTKLILVDVVCRAVPSPGVWRKYVEMQNKVHGEIEKIRFRDKTLGYQYSTMEMKMKNGNIFRGGIDSQLWLRMFFSGMIIRPSCTQCKFRNRYRNSDFTIWDCFNVAEYTKDLNENLGATRMLIHSIKGNQIFDKIKDDFYYKEIQPDLAVKNVNEMVNSPGFNNRRESFFKDLSKKDFMQLTQEYFPITIKIRIRVMARRVLNKLKLDGVIKRAVRKFC